MGDRRRDDMIVHELEPYNAEPPRAALAGKPLTPVDAFYSRNHGPVPAIPARDWRLAVDGLVATHLGLSLTDLQDGYPEHSVVATLQCAGNRRRGFLAFGDIPGEAPWGSTATSTAEWTGVRLTDVLGRAKVGSQVEHIEFLAPDIAQGATPPQPYGSSIPVDKAMAGEVLLAWAMNGEPLPAGHGGPVRVVVPGYIGARSVKWVQRIRAQENPSDNYFQAVAYRLASNGISPRSADGASGPALAAVPLTADILSPDDGAILGVGPTEVTGYAFAGDGADIARVEVSMDAGRTWQVAALQDRLGRWAWCQWRMTVDLPAGVTQIVARAWDTAGACQPESARDLWNPKGYLNNSWPRVHVSAITD